MRFVFQWGGKERWPGQVNGCFIAGRLDDPKREFAPFAGISS